MGQEKHTYYNYQFEHTTVSVANHPDIQTQAVAEALVIHPLLLNWWKRTTGWMKYLKLLSIPPVPVSVSR